MNDKLKELEEHSAQIFELGCMERPVYLKEDVDAVIAGLKQKLDEQEAENRRLKRALYKACANWMIDRQLAMRCFHLEARAKKFDKAITKCRAKAEDYK